MVDLCDQLRAKPMLCSLLVLCKPGSQVLDFKIMKMPIRSDAAYYAKQPSACSFALVPRLSAPRQSAVFIHAFLHSC